MRNTKIPQTQYDKMRVSLGKEKCLSNHNLSANMKTQMQIFI